jgi:hypothetical protein
LTDVLLHVDELATKEYKRFHQWFLNEELCDVNSREALIDSLQKIETARPEDKLSSNEWSRIRLVSDNNKQKEGTELKLKTLREILKTQTNKPRGATKKTYFEESDYDDGGISSEFAYIARFDYDNQRVIEQIKRDIMAMSKWADVAVSVIAVSED